MNWRVGVAARRINGIVNWVHNPATAPLINCVHLPVHDVYFLMYGYWLTVWVGHVQRSFMSRMCTEQAVPDSHPFAIITASPTVYKGECMRHVLSVLMSLHFLFVHTSLSYTSTSYSKATPLFTDLNLRSAAFAARAVAKAARELPKTAKRPRTSCGDGAGGGETAGAYLCTRR